MFTKSIITILKTETMIYSSKYKYDSHKILRDWKIYAKECIDVTLQKQNHITKIMFRN